MGMSLYGFNELLRETVSLGDIEAPAFLPDDIGFARLAELGSQFSERLQHRRQIKSGTADDLKHVGCRSLLP